MKNNKFILVFSAIAMILGSFFFVQCKEIKDPTDGLKLIINYNLIKTTLSVTFIDAATGDPIGYNDFRVVNVNINGPDADKILDVTGAIKTSFSSAKGFLGFGLDPSFTPSPGNPINFTIVAKSNGYASTSIPVSILEESNRSIIITMVDLNNLPEGVASVSDNSVYVSGNVVDSDVVIETPAAGTTGTKAQLTVRQGTTIKDADGNVLTGNFITKMVYYNNMDDGALAAFPGGLTASADINGNTENVIFYSGGFASIEMTDGSGTKATTFENNDLELMIEISNNTYNRNTGAQIQDQDSVPLWTYDLESGNWNMDGWTLIEESGGKFQTTANLSHLSFFNLDWYWPWPFGPTPSEVFLRVFFNSKAALENPEDVALEIIVRKKADGTFINKYLILAPVGEDYPIGQWALGNEPVIFEIRSMCDLTPQFEEISDPSQGIYEIYLQNVQSTGQTVTIDFEGWCPNNPEVLIRPTTPFVYRDYCSRSVGGGWIWAYMVDGHAVLYNVELTHLYSVGVYYDGEFHEETFEFDGTNQSYSIEFTPEVCNIVAP